MLNENIKRLRKENKWSQDEFGQMVGVKKAYVSQIENNPEYNPAISFVAEMADVFGVSIDYLYRGEEYSNADALKVKLDQIEKELEEVRQAIPGG